MNLPFEYYLYKLAIYYDPVTVLLCNYLNS